MSIDTLYELIWSLQCDSRYCTVGVMHDRHIWCISGSQINVYLKNCQVIIHWDMDDRIICRVDTPDNKIIKEDQLRYVEINVPNIISELEDGFSVWTYKELPDLLL